MARTPSPYDDLVMDHIRNARNFRRPAGGYRHSRGLNPLCGDEVHIYLGARGDRLEDVAFQCTCCGISMASASMATEAVTGLDVDAALARARAVAAAIRTRTDSAVPDAIVAALVGTAREFPARAGCALLPWVTLEAALEGRAEAGVDS